MENSIRMVARLCALRILFGGGGLLKASLSDRPSVRATMPGGFVVRAATHRDASVRAALTDLNEKPFFAEFKLAKADDFVTIMGNVDYKLQTEQPKEKGIPVRLLHLLDAAASSPDEAVTAVIDRMLEDLYRVEDTGLRIGLWEMNETARCFLDVCRTSPDEELASFVGAVDAEMGGHLSPLKFSNEASIRRWRVMMNRDEETTPRLGAELPPLADGDIFKI